MDRSPGNRLSAQAAIISPAARSSLKTVHWTVLLAFGKTFLTARGVRPSNRSSPYAAASDGSI